MASDETGNRAIVWGVAGLLSLAICCFVWSRLPPPQLVHNEQVFNTVDALFTAMTSRDATRVDECERRLHAYHADGLMSDSAKSFLDSIIAEARSGKWEPAAKRLYDFILGQSGAPVGTAS